MAETKKKSKSTAQKRTAETNRKVKSKKNTQQEPIPVRYILAPIWLILAVVAGFACFSGHGFFLKWIRDFLSGLLGFVGLYLSPVLFLGLFVICALFYRHHMVRRSVCLCLTVVHLSAIAHLLVQKESCKWGISMIGALYKGGIAGESGGVLGGLLGSLAYSACDKILGIIVLVLLGVIFAAGTVDITIPNLIRAFKNRPRPEYDEPEERDPAEVVVNHLANKHIEHVARKKKMADYDVPVDDVPLTNKKVKPSKPRMRTPDQVLEESIREEQSQKQPREPVELFDEELITGATVITPMAPIEPQDDEPFTTFSFNEPARQAEPPVEPVAPPCPVEAEMPVQPEPVEQTPPKQSQKVTTAAAEESAAEVAREVEEKAKAQKIQYVFPPLSLLKASNSGSVDGTTELRENTRRLNEALQSFKIEAKICNVTRGPSVTRYEVELAQGVRLAKITTLQNDLALALGAVSVRISAIPEKIAMVGIEVPNKQVTMVSLREVIGSAKFITAKSKSSFAVGKDISGDCIVGNIAGLPHMLIAGTTGSGKSVCMNSLIVSLLYKATPEDVKLIMVDPKMVELGIYNGIPHLLIPVVTDPKKAAGSLQWAVAEMMRRYKLMYDASVRDLDSLNRIVETTGEGEKLPQIVVIIDELADLMMVAAKEVEDSVVRIAQMGRASGIHLIIATQRPSADVITGIMKANIPSRIAFAVASAMESRIILDNPGAEKLVGKGDMLYAPLGMGKPHRVQGCFVSDGEVAAVAEYVKEHCTTEYNQEVLDEIERKATQDTKGGKSGGDDFGSEEVSDGDELLPDAVEVFLETGQASVSMLQRRLKLGYARAARIVDEMEEKGIVGPFVGSKPRAILVTKEQWKAMQSGETPPDPGTEEIPELIP